MTEDLFHIYSQQTRNRAAAVFSLQWALIARQQVEAPDGWQMIDRYLPYIRRFTCNLVRPTRDDRFIELRLCPWGPCLIRFEIPSARTTPPSRVGLIIYDGLLVHRSGRRHGLLSFCCQREKGGIRLALHLTDYRPALLGTHPGRLRLWFYRLTQAAIHRRVGIGFLRLLHNELTGRKLPLQVHAGNELEGSPL